MKPLWKRINCLKENQIRQELKPTPSGPYLVSCQHYNFDFNYLKFNEAVNHVEEKDYSKVKVVDVFPEDYFAKEIYAFDDESRAYKIAYWYDTSD